MDKEYFTLTKGVLEIKNDRLLIDDEESNKRFSKTLGSVFGLLTGVIYIFKGQKDQDFYYLTFGIALTLTWVFILFFAKRQITDSEILFQRIEKIEFKKPWFGKKRTGRINTSDQKVRLIEITENEMLETQLVKKLRAKGIVVVF